MRNTRIRKYKLTVIQNLDNIRISDSLSDVNSKMRTFTSPRNSTLMNFVVNSQEHFEANSAVHIVNTWNNNQLHRPIDNLSTLQKSACYAVIKILNSLPSNKWQNLKNHYEST